MRSCAVYTQYVPSGRRLAVARQWAASLPGSDKENGKAQPLSRRVPSGSAVVDGGVDMSRAGVGAGIALDVACDFHATFHSRQGQGVGLRQPALLGGFW